MKRINHLFILINIIISIIFISGKSQAVTENSFLDSDTVKVSSILKSQNLSKYKLNQKYNLKITHVQGFCTDGKYFYIACLTGQNKNADDRYAKQQTVIIKIDKAGNLIGSLYLKGDNGLSTGHSNSVAYSSIDNSLLIAPCSYTHPYIYKISANFKGKKTTNPHKITLYTDSSKNTSYLSNSRTAKAMAFDEGRNEYLIVTNNHSIAFFDSNCVLLRTIEMKKDSKLLKDNESNSFSLKGFKYKLNSDGKKSKYYTGQSIYCDSVYIYSVYCLPVVSKTTYKNYISIFDYNGNYIKTIDISDEIEKITKKIANNKVVELEEIYSYKGKFYAIGNIKQKNKNGTQFTHTSPKSIQLLELDLKNNDNYDVAYYNPINYVNKYQSIKYGANTSLLSLSNNKTFMKNINKTLKGYKTYRNDTKKWYTANNNDSKWVSQKKITDNNLQFKLYTPNRTISHTVKPKNSVLMIAQFEIE